MGLMNAPEASDSNLSEVLQGFVAVVGPRTLQHEQPIYARGRLVPSVGFLNNREHV
jgi:hypothetical protein